MQMEASSAVVVALAFAERFPLPQGFGFLVPEGPQEEQDTSLLACTFMDQKFPERAPQNARLLRAFFGGKAAKRIASMDDTSIASLAHHELQAILGPLPAPIATVIRRWPRSLPQYAVGHLDRMAELDARICALPNLYLLGNGYRGVGLPDIIRDSRAAARAAAHSFSSTTISIGALQDPHLDIDRSHHRPYRLQLRRIPDRSPQQTTSPCNHHRVQSPQAVRQPARQRRTPGSTIPTRRHRVMAHHASALVRRHQR